MSTGQIDSCPLAAGPFPPGSKLCDWCGKQLVGRQQRWCSEAHSFEWARNHAWTAARHAARTRDGGRCLVCGADGSGPPGMTAWWHFVAWVTRRPLPLSFMQWRDVHHPGEPIEPMPHGHDIWLEWRRYVDALTAPWRAIEAEMAAFAQRLEIEVNHVTPIDGKHDQAGCWHHQDGLETLCHSCHLLAGRAQRNGVIGVRARDLTLGDCWPHLPRGAPCDCGRPQARHTLPEAHACGLVSAMSPRPPDRQESLRL